jgi:hypothetical protein
MSGARQFNLEWQTAAKTPLRAMILAISNPQTLGELHHRSAIAENGLIPYFLKFGPASVRPPISGILRSRIPRQASARPG